MEINTLLVTWTSLGTLAAIMVAMLGMQGLQVLFRLPKKYHTFMHAHDGIVTVHLYTVSKTGGSFSEYDFQKDEKGRYHYYVDKDGRRVNGLIILAATVVYILVVVGFILKNQPIDREDLWIWICFWGWLYIVLFAGIYTYNLMNRFVAWRYLNRHRGEISE